MSKIKNMKKILSVFTSAALALGGTGMTSAVVSQLSKVSAASAGDLNNDGKISAADVVMLQQYLTKQRQLDSLSAADLTGDGKVNVFDLVAIKNKAILFINKSLFEINRIYRKEDAVLHYLFANSIFATASLAIGIEYPEHDA